MRQLALVLGLLAVLAAPPAAAISLGGIRNSLVQWVLDKVSVEGVFEISVEEVVGAEDEGTTLRGVEIADADGVWFTADELTFDFDRSRLLRGQLVIQTLRLGGAEVMRQPVIPPGEEIEVDLEDAEAPPEQFIWPRSPVSTEIANLVIDGIHLHEPLLGHEISFDATGAFRDIGDVQAASLDLQRTDEIAGTIDLEYTRDFDENTLVVDLRASEGEGGLVASLLDLPETVPTALTLTADGTPEALDVAFDLDMPEYLEVDGMAVLDYAGPISVDATVTARPGPLMPEQVAQVLGDEAELVVKAAEGDDQLLEIETARISSPYLRATATGEYSRASGAADLEVELVAEPELAAPFEGVEFAGLSFSGTVRGEPGSLAADGDLQLQGFSTATAAIDEATLNIDVSQSGTAEQPTTELAVQGRVAGLRLDQIPADVIGDASIQVAARQTGAEIVLETAAIDSEVLDVSASGTANTETGDFDISYQLSAPQIEPVLEPYGVAAEGTITAGGQAASEAGVLRLETAADLTDFTYPQLAAERLHLEGTVVQYSERTTFALSGTGEAMRIDQIGPDLLDRADLAASGMLEGETLRLAEARLTSPVLEVTADGTVETDGSDGQISYRITSEQIGPVAQAYGVDAEGTVGATGTVELAPEGLTLTTDADLEEFRSEFADAGRLHIEGTVAQAGERTSFDLTGAGERLRIDRIGPDLLDRAEFAAKGALDGQELTLEQARLVSPLLRAAADGTVDLETMTGRIRYDIDSVALGPVAEIYEQDLAGTASAEGVVDLLATDGAADAAADAAAEGAPDGTADGTAAAAPVPQIVGQAAVADFVYAGTPVGDIVLEHDVTLSGAPAGTLDLSLRDGPFAPAGVETRFRLEGQRLTLDGLDLRAFGMTAAGDLAVDLETTLAEGTLDIDAADLARLPGAPVTGRADGRLRLSNEGGRQDASLTLAAGGLTAAGVAIGGARIEGRVRDALGTPAIDLDIAAERIVSGGLTLASATTTVDGPLSGLRITLRAAGELDRKPLALSAAARADLAGETIRATIGELDLAIGEDRIALLQPLTVTSSGGVTRLDDIALGLPDNGRLTGELGYFGGPLAGTILLDMPDLSVLSRLFDAPIEAGALRVAADFDTRPGRVDADIEITGREIVFADISGAGVLGMDAAIAWDGRRAQVDGRVSGSFGEPLVIDAALPVTAAGGLPALADRGPVSARVRWNGEIGELWAIVPAAGHVVTGETAIDIGVSGDISSPSFTGGILIADGTYQNLDLGTILTGLSLATEIEAGGALGLRLEAVDGADGTVRVEGRVGFTEGGVDLRVETREAVLVRRDDAAVRLGVDLRISGPMDQLAIAGQVRIIEAEIRLVNANPPSIVTLGDVRIKGEPLPDDEDGAGGLPIRLQIDVTGDRIFVRGRGLDSEWEADLAVRGDASQPIVTGEVSAVRGQLELIGKTFELEQGRVLFDGGRQIDPRIDVVLERETPDIVGRIVVQGFASDPQLSFTSSPALPEDEVLPQVLFGTSSQALTPSQGIQLALGLATLLDGGGGTLDQLRGAVGLDSLDIEQDAEGNASLAIGKQVQDNIWVGTRQSLGDGGTSVAVEVDVFENVQVQGEVGTEGDTSASVQWKKDF